MNQEIFNNVLANLPLGGLRYFDQVGSTNDEALKWLETGAPDLALVIADEQTAGRGQRGRRWFTPPGSALAFSLILKELPSSGKKDGCISSNLELIARIIALGALGVAEALQNDYGIPAQIKWPNDVLLNRRKVAGVLVESQWEAEQLKSAILGIGVNVTPQAIPPEAKLAFPATCVQTVLGYSLSRPDLLHAILAQLMQWVNKLPHPDFLQSWDRKLAFRDEWVFVNQGERPGRHHSHLKQVIGLDSQGRLKLRDQDGTISATHIGELYLRPSNFD